MAAFFSNQLDFILFFYGLAFILLGAVCIAVARGTDAVGNTIPWRVLGAFAYLHGAGEWLDLSALIFGDSESFAIVRTALMTVSYVVLVEFGRLDAKQRGFAVPGRWIYVPLGLLVVFGWHLAGVSGANALARYVFGLPGALLASAMLVSHARQSPVAEKPWLLMAAIGLALYAIAAGAIVPPTPGWRGDLINYDLFVHITGTPIQFVRGLLACCISFGIWVYWGERLASDVGSAQYSEFQRKQFYRTLGAFGAILIVGWLLTETLGEIYKRNVEQESKGDITLISSRLAIETMALDGMVKVLAGTETIARLGEPGRNSDADRAKNILTLNMQAARADDAFILDQAGKVLVATDDSSAVIGDDFSAAPYFKTPLAGKPGYHFKFDPLDNAPYYYASYPLRAVGGGVSGVVVLKKALGGFETDLKTFDRSFALIDRHGVVLITNRPGLRFHTLWPLPSETIEAIAIEYGSILGKAALQDEIQDSGWVRFNGNRDYVQRRPVTHGDWSLVTWKAPQGIFASRVLGIIITLQMTIIAMVYLVGREHWIHDRIQLEKRLKLEELARKLDSRAATDPLTGLFNRGKFDRLIAAEIMRARRYQSPLALIMFDVDHFKKVNDTLGHQAGDAVLIELSRYIGTRLRATDILARWGGEEFVILCPGTDTAKACQLAEGLRAAIEALNFRKTGAVTCSFGVSAYEDDDTPERLVARADDALYRAKGSGRNRVELATRPETASPSLQPAG